ncbi:uncharacterized protein LOC115888157 [Sitophilus oryzae]|uniref:Uncharacterized protein LOC115888157 n=1 Tax=Sitophilus oryzae TaxID=7048 RepID=A0A6J2YKE7_SITOR|nr:uncharacterized protein LOC115888157 [Sitophilus oryzae]XP_030763613.1 uncharacterized protein LOC115888157 [Sitophilus oryzae]XP_030763614.1 uncharacterized protein LOC115888157 [Sitophilus oryzae]
MEDKERVVQKHIVAFCSILPSHIECWKTTLKELQNPIKAVSNFAEQLRYVDRAKISYINDFEQVQNQLKTKILIDIEQELESIKNNLDKLSKINQDLKNKLSQLERSTIDINWDSESFTIRGSPTQPALTIILQLGYQYHIFFSDILKNVNRTLKCIDFKNDKSIEQFVKSCPSNIESLDCKNIKYLLALTQYVVTNKNT